MPAGRSRVWLVAIVTMLTVTGLVAGCTPSEPRADPTPSPTPARVVTAANLLTAADIPRPEGDGTIRAYTKNARPLAGISVCQQDLAQLGVTSSVDGAFKQFGGTAPKEGSKAPLADEPDLYVAALQFGSAQAALQARETYKSWVDTCRNGLPTASPFEAVDRGFAWTGIEVAQGEATVAEIAYRPRGTKTEANYWESVGLTVVGDRLMVTVFIFYALEDLYGLEAENDESGFPLPQVQMVDKASSRLTA